MLNWFKEYCRKRYVARFKRSSDTSFINLKELSSVAFVFGVDSAEAVDELVEVCRYLKGKGLEFKGLAVETSKGILKKEDLKEWKELGAVAFEKLSWIGIPDDSQIKDFFAGKYDLFVNFNPNGNFTLDYIFANYATSPMRAGMANDERMPYNLVVQGKEKEILPVLQYLEQIFHYLNLMRTKQVEADE